VPKLESPFFRRSLPTVIHARILNERAEETLVLGVLLELRGLDISVILPIAI
jgi:hypothetical protein